MIIVKIFILSFLRRCFEIDFLKYFLKILRFRIKNKTLDFANQIEPLQNVKSFDCPYASANRKT